LSFDAEPLSLGKTFSLGGLGVPFICLTTSGTDSMLAVHPASRRRASDQGNASRYECCAASKLTVCTISQVSTAEDAERFRLGTRAWPTDARTGASLSCCLPAPARFETASRTQRLCLAALLGHAACLLGASASGAAPPLPYSDVIAFRQNTRVSRAASFASNCHRAKSETEKKHSPTYGRTHEKMATFTREQGVRVMVSVRVTEVEAPW
jgi:hypothetical protein